MPFHNRHGYQFLNMSEPAATTSAEASGHDNDNDNDVTATTDTVAAAAAAAEQPNDKSVEDKKRPEDRSTSTDSFAVGSVDKLFHDEFDKTYLDKSKVLSDAIADVGMGKYQWLLFVVCGFGWMADNLWPIVSSLVLPQVILEFLPAGSPNGPYITLAQNLGLLAGAVFWSFSSDVWGRRLAFNLTFLITGAWGVVAGSAPTFAALGVFTSFYSFGVGGNLPVDSAIFLEFLPQSHQYLLTVESVWWAFGQLLTNAIGLGFMSNYACQSSDAGNCKREDNMGWRYLFFTMGAISLLCFAVRFFFFRMYESPKFLLARNQEEEAVAVVHKVALANGKESSLSIEDLRAVDRVYGTVEEQEHPKSANLVLKEKLQQFNFSHLRQVFGTKKLAYSSTLIILIWAIIGVAFPLYNAFIPYFLATRFKDNSSTFITYRNSLIQAALGVPGSLLAGAMVELKLVGRKGTLSAATLLTGVFLFGSTTAQSPNQLLGWNCGFTFVSNIMYGVLYAGTAESFPTVVRGTGIGLASSANRVLGVFAPIIAMYADLTTSVPIYVAGALFLAAGLLILGLPYEPRGHASL